MDKQTATIHPTAIVEPGARIGKNVQIGAYSIVGPFVVLEDDVEIKPHVFLDGHTTIGRKTTVWPFASIGTKTQDLKFRGERTYVRIGECCDIREYVTINSSCGAETAVEVGDGCLIMAYCHIAHNCSVGKKVIMSNGSTLAGHVTIEDCVVISGLSAFHQYSRVGRYAMVGGMSRVTHDVPPFTLGYGAPYSFGGINRVGLIRHGFSNATIHILMKAFRILYRLNVPIAEAIEKIKAEVEDIEEVRHFVRFCETTTRGIIADANKGIPLETEEVALVSSRGVGHGR